MKKKNRIDKITALLEKNFDTFFIKAPTKTGLGVLLGCILYSIGNNVISQLTTLPTLPIYFWIALSILVLNFRNLFTNHVIDEELEAKIHYIEMAQKHGKFSSAEQRQQWRNFIRLVAEKATADMQSIEEEIQELQQETAEEAQEPQQETAKEAQEPQQENLLITQLLKEKNSGNSVTYLALLLTFCAEFAQFLKSPETSISLTMLFTVLMFVCHFANQRVLKYRVEHGLYGTCYSESKEIIAFALKWYKEHNGSNTGMPKLVFNEIDLMQVVFLTSGGQEYAG